MIRLNYLVFVASISFGILTSGCSSAESAANNRAANPSAWAETTWRMKEAPAATSSNTITGPATSEEAIAKIQFILSEHEGVRERMRGFSYVAVDSRKLYNAPGEPPLVLDRVIRVTRDSAGSILVEEEHSDTPRFTPTPSNIPTLESMRNSGKPISKRHLRLPDRYYYWPNVLEPKMILFRDTANWEGDSQEFAEQMLRTIDSVEPSILSVSQEAGATLKAHTVHLGKDGLKWRWEVLEEGEGMLRIRKMSRTVKGRCLLAFLVDMERGCVVLEAISTRKGAKGPQRIVQNTYQEVNGVLLLESHRIHEDDTSGQTAEEREIRYQDYRPADSSKPLSIVDLKAPDNAIFAHHLAGRKYDEKKYRLDENNLVPTGAQTPSARP